MSYASTLARLAREADRETTFPSDPETRVYAIAFDMDPDTLQRAYPGPTWTNGYAEIARVLARHGFSRQQGSVSFGDGTVNAVTCVLAAIDRLRTLPWFTVSVRDIRMLRIEELNDLSPAVQQAAGLAPPN